jgi:hypothetical protein
MYIANSATSKGAGSLSAAGAFGWALNDRTAAVWGFHTGQSGAAQLARVPVRKREMSYVDCSVGRNDDGELCRTAR